MWSQTTCDYYVTTMTPAVQRIKGNYVGNGYYYTIDHINEPDSCKLILGLLKIEVELIGDTTYTAYFYYDVRDCQFYGLCDHHQGDIILRYDKDDKEIYFFNGNNPYNDPPNSPWEVVNSSTKYFWINQGLTHCPLTPATPTGFTISGNVGSHPYLSWNANTEQMLDGYNLYQSINGASYSLLITLEKNTTSYTDNGITIGDKRTDPLSCYRLTAFGKANNESPMTIPRCKRAGEVSKEANNTNETVINLVNKLYEAYPNPFNPTTIIQYDLAEGSFVKLKIYDILGHEIKTLVNEYKNKSTYFVTFQSNNLSTGIYIYTLELNDYFDSKIISFIK